RWARHDPDAAARLTAARAALAELSEQVQVPVENLVGPELVRRLCWEWRVSADTDVVAYIEERFATDGARPWQRELTAPRLAKALTAD
ncbi:3'-5' exonuclease, partial [Rhodococcus rhodochrous]